MATRWKKPVDMAGVKRSRASHTGTVTRVWDRFKAIPCDQPEEIQQIKVTDIKTNLKTLLKTEVGFALSVEEAQDFAPEDEGEDAAFQEEEEEAAETFTHSLAAARELGEQLLAYKAVLTGIAIFKTDLDALQQSLDTQPDQDNSHSLSDLHTSFSALREQWVTADLNTDNPVKAELDACKRSLTAMQRDVSAAKARSDSASSTSSASSGHPTPHYSPHPYSELPKIKVPTFNGDLMEWSTFWSTFKTTVEDRKDLTNSQRLNYLR